MAKPDGDYQLIPMVQIRIDGGTQARASLDESRVAEYAESIGAGADFPPLIVFNDGKDYWLAGGFHRYHSYRRHDYGEVRCEVRNGTKRDALLFAVGDNATHGLPRSTEDKRRAIELLLADSEWGNWSIAKLAEAARVSHQFAGDVRAEWEEKQAPAREPDAGPKRVIGRDGKSYPANIKQAPAREPDERKPDSEPLPMPELDPLGQPIPDDADVKLAFATAKRGSLLSRQFKAGLSEFAAIAALPGGQKLHVPTATAAVEGIVDLLKRALPVSVCPDCNGYGCNSLDSTCGGVGWINGDRYAALSKQQKQHCERFTKKAA